MALLATQTIDLSGEATDLAAAAGGGDTFTPTDRTYLHVKNGDAGTPTVTIVTPRTVIGQGIADVAVVISATTGDVKIGPFPAQHFADPSTGLASITYSAVTTLTVGVFALDAV